MQLALPLACLALPAMAGGARTGAACVVGRACHAQGTCGDSAGQRPDLVVARQGTDADGRGDYALTPGDEEAALARGSCATGPSVRTAPNGDNLTLTLLPEGSRLLRVQQGQRSQVRITYLNCEISA